MKTIKLSAGLLVFFLSLGTLPAQKPGSDAPPAQNPRSDALPAPAAEPGPCVVDRELSLWLTLEAIDRMIAALESDRRTSVEELAAVRAALDTIARSRTGDENSLTALIAQAQAAEGGEDRLLTSYSDLESRLVDIDKTLERRRAQQAAVEAKLEAFLLEE